jgi:hypothetical protein
MEDERLIQLENHKFIEPELPWEKRKQLIYEDLAVIIKIFEENTDDPVFIERLKKLEEKFK